MMTKDKGKHTLADWLADYLEGYNASPDYIALNPHAMADALLQDYPQFAAAPELLEACQALLLAYRRTRPQIAGTDALEEQTRAALRKAGAEEHNG